MPDFVMLKVDLEGRQWENASFWVVLKFKTCASSLDDAKSSVLPSPRKSDEDVELVKERVAAERRISISLVSKILRISIESVQSQNDLKIRILWIVSSIVTTRLLPLYYLCFNL